MQDSLVTQEICNTPGIQVQKLHANCQTQSSSLYYVGIGVAVVLFAIMVVVIFKSAHK